jgi:hypothetical protein
MRTVWKYQLVKLINILELPYEARVLCVKEQCGVICLWALVDPQAKPIQRTFRVYGTGQPIPESYGEYIGSVQSKNEQFVYHIFEA